MESRLPALHFSIRPESFCAAPPASAEAPTRDEAALAGPPARIEPDLVDERLAGERSFASRRPCGGRVWNRPLTAQEVADLYIGLFLDRPTWEKL